jgi:hypothetical protein
LSRPLKAQYGSLGLEKVIALLKNIVLVTIPTVAVIYLLLELTFTFVIPAAETPYYYYDLKEDILRYSTIQRQGLYTIGPKAKQRASWHINNAGWNSPIEFEKDKERQRIAIIGDSYVEALQVNADDSFTGHLRRLISQEAQVDVYAFGISGATLSQYLQMARYIRINFNPDIFVFNVVHNDFDDSLCAVKRQPGMLCLENDRGMLREAAIMPYEPNPLLRIARRSSLIRFLVINLQMRARLQQLIAGLTTIPTYNAGIDVSEVQSKKGKIAEATSYILSTLKRELGEKPVLIVMDASRKDIYDGTIRESNVRWLNELLKQKTMELGFSFLDLTEVFIKSFETDNVRFEWPYDGHWNEKGHKVVANALHERLRTMLKCEHS